MRVLVIDDDIVYRNGISIAAKNRKWQPVACKDIETAKQIPPARRPCRKSLVMAGFSPS